METVLRIVVATILIVFALVVSPPMGCSLLIAVAVIGGIILASRRQ